MNAADRKRLHGLYAITDHNIPAGHFAEAVEAALAGGAGILQYRDKSADDDRRLQQATVCRDLCVRYGSVFIVNDDIELCKKTGADGVHLGRDDNSIEQARDVLGDEAAIGVSCYDDIERAVAAQQAGADYVAFGTMFASPTKPRAVTAGPALITEARQHIELPICGIGGITADNAHLVIGQGADMIAVISFLFGADDIRATAGRLADCLSADRAPSVINGD